VIAKQLFGGIGRNLINPALVGRVFIVLSGASALVGKWMDSIRSENFLLKRVELVAGVAPLSYVGGDDAAAAFRELTEKYSLLDMLLGKNGGSMGEICTLVLLAGGLYLMGRKIISWHIPVSYIATVAALTFLFPRGGADNLQWMLYSLCGGGLMLSAFFMATDYATSPIIKRGQLIYGIGCGLFTVLIRYFSSGDDGAYYAIMVMNCCTGLIDKCNKPARFGSGKSGRSPAR
jgi:electron transport complex protein RnfD